MPRGMMSTLAAIEHTVESVARIYESGAGNPLELPTLIGLRQHVYDS